mmetsp:Transcript_34211/g.98492  ORF Transcript_34211/g.98492 Transcript_34211/m.98492 type:complete len:277 (+) Transcript_34211:1130-1960(+)
MFRINVVGAVLSLGVSRDGDVDVRWRGALGGGAGGGGVGGTTLLLLWVERPDEREEYGQQDDAVRKTQHQHECHHSEEDDEYVAVHSEDDQHGQKCRKRAVEHRIAHQHQCLSRPVGPCWPNGVAKGMRNVSGRVHRETDGEYECDHGDHVELQVPVVHEAEEPHVDGHQHAHDQQPTPPMPHQERRHDHDGDECVSEAPECVFQDGDVALVVGEHVRIRKTTQQPTRVLLCLFAVVSAALHQVGPRDPLPREEAESVVLQTISVEDEVAPEDLIL